VSFTSPDYAVFLLIVVSGYWLLSHARYRKLLLLGSSYVFYGWVHPWFCWLILGSTLVDFYCARAMAKTPHRRRLFLTVSLVFNLGMLGFFKYFNFFADSVSSALTALGVPAGPMTLEIFLPVGISFYTFQTLSYTLDVYGGRLKPTDSLLDFATFVALFPQLVAGPIERAAHLLPQIAERKSFCGNHIARAWPLILRGLVKKLVIADNVAVQVNQVFALENPGGPLLVAGTCAFALQILCDFSGYTDIARGSARLLGLELMENFRCPYRAISPSDFWRRWHISLSSWINDYLYIPLGGSRQRTRTRFLATLILTMGLSGLWHGAAWHFVVWGLYHSIILFIYHLMGKGGRWQPRGKVSHVFSWLIMLTLTLVGWAIFRAPSLSWLWHAWGQAVPGISSAAEVLVARSMGATVVLHGAFLLVYTELDRRLEQSPALFHLLHGLALCVLFLMASSGEQDFIYFRF